MTFQPGQIIKDTYRVERRLGAGGMAEVYLVSHTRLPRQFALKLMLVDTDGRKEFLDRFRREAEVLAKLRHPHIVDVNDWDFLDGRPYLVMEYLEGETLDAFLHRTGPLSVPVALDICAQIGQALDTTHAAGIVHRDLKPSNIFLDKNGNKPNFVKILDFGIAKVEHVGQTPLTAQSAVMGTPGYMAPEQALGKTDEIDERTDQFALAAILYEMLAGHPAFYSPGDTVYAILARIVTEPVPPLPYEPINSALQRALSKKATERFPSLQAFLTALAGKDTTLVFPLPYTPPLSTIGTGESTRPVPIPASRPWTKRWGVPLLAVAGIMMGLGAAKLRHQTEKPRPAVLVPTDLAVAMDSALQPADASVPEDVPDGSAPTDFVPPEDLLSPEDLSQKTKPPLGHVGREYTITGANPKQTEVIRLCISRTLKGLNLPLGTTFNFERSGTLKVVKWPDSYYPNELQQCLRDAFSVSSTPTPAAVTIRLTPTKR